MNSPLVSIIIPSYNHEKFVATCLKSVVSQTYKNIEVIVVDDGSLDNTIGEIKNNKDHRIKLHEFKKNQGAAIATNYGISMATGKYIAILNSDDFWYLDKIEKQVNFLEENKNYQAVFGWAQFVDEDSQIIKSFSEDNIFKQKNRSKAGWVHKFYYDFNCLCHPTIMILRECYDSIGLYDNRLRQLPDFEMWVKFIKKYNFYILEEPLINFRILKNDNNASKPTIENTIRTENELYFIMSDFFTGLSPDVFRQAFKHKIKYSDFEFDFEYQAEQILLLLSEHYWSDELYDFIGIQQLYKLLGEYGSEVKEHLSKRYGIDDKFLQEQTKSVNVFNKIDKNESSTQQLPDLNSYRVKDLFRECYKRSLYKLKRKVHAFLIR